MSIIDSLKRLERAGGEESVSNQKLRIAAAEVGDSIAGMFADARRLPRDYWIVVGRGDGPGSGKTFLQCARGGFIGSDLRHFHDSSAADREDILKFAEDIAGGLLDEIAGMLETRNAESEKASEILRDHLVAK